LVDLQRARVVKFMRGDRWLLRETKTHAADTESLKHPDRE
jgi:hypothetical protein